jgi:hypothetical protein
MAPSYGLGWMTAVYRGNGTVHHGRSTLDFSSPAVFFPRAQTGVVVLINASSPADGIQAYGLSPIGWNRRTAYQINARRPSGPAEKPIEGTRPAHPLEESEDRASERSDIREDKVLSSLAGLLALEALH